MATAAKKKGRPKNPNKRKTVSITLEPATWSALHAHAAKDGRTLSSEVNWIIRAYFMNHKLRESKDKAKQQIANMRNKDEELF